MKDIEAGTKQYHNSPRKRIYPETLFFSLCLLEGGGHGLHCSLDNALKTPKAPAISMPHPVLIFFFMYNNIIRSMIEEIHNYSGPLADHN